MHLNFPKIAAIILLSSLLGLAVNYFGGNGLPLIYKSTEIGWADESLIDLHLQEEFAEDNSSSSVDENIKLPPVEDEPPQKNENVPDVKENKTIKEETAAIPAPVKVDVDLAFKLYNNDALFLDARPIEEFNEGHIKGAITLPYYSEDHETTLSRIPKDQPVVVYCSGTDCDLSIMMGNKLHKMGYQKVFVFFGGWDEWFKRDFPVELKEENI